MKPVSGEKLPLQSSSRSQIWRGVRSQEGQSRDCSLISLARLAETGRSTNLPPCGALRWLVTWGTRSLVNGRRGKIDRDAEGARDDWPEPNKRGTRVRRSLSGKPANIGEFWRRLNVGRWARRGLNEKWNSLPSLETSTCWENDRNCIVPRKASAGSSGFASSFANRAIFTSTSCGPTVGPFSAVMVNFPSMIAVPAAGPFDPEAGRNVIIPRCTGAPS